MVIKIFSLLVIFLCFHLNANDSFDIDKLDISDTFQLMTRHQLLDEIERLNGEIDELVQVGYISSSVALAVSATFSVIVYSITTGGLTCFALDKGKDITGVVKLDTLLSLFPGLGLGGLLGFMNSEPYVPAEESFWLSFKSIISTTGFWLAGNAGMSILSLLSYRKDMDISMVTDGLYWSGFVMIPLHAYFVYANLTNRMEARENKLFDLKFQLNKARDYLNGQTLEAID